MVCATTSLTKSALETLVAAVCGEDQDEDVAAADGEGSSVTAPLRQKVVICISPCI